MSDSTGPGGTSGGVFYGIDFGTWASALVVLRRGQPPLAVRDPVSAHGATFVRSAVCLLPDGSMLVGQAAQNSRLRYRERFRAEFKREFGEPFPHRLGERRFSSEELTARVLGFLVEQARRAVGAEPDRVAITVPATWERARRALMLDAAEAAGLRPETVEVHTEPVAAAVYALHDHGVDRERTILVYDLGGGTFDLAIARGTRDGLTVLGSPGGLPHAGGLAIDQVVLGLIRDRCPTALDCLRSSGESEGNSGSGRRADDRAAEVLRRRTQLAETCTAFKQQLSVSPEHTDLLTMLDPPVEVTLTQDELREAVRPLLSDTVAECERVLKGHGLGWADLDLIVPVGGSSRLPMVGELLATRSGRPVMDVSEPELAVATGAAWLARGAVPAHVAAPPALSDAPPEPRRVRTFPAGVRALLDAGLTDRMVLEAVRRART
ncbi:Hsp70 family protein [Streptomyces sp. GQFP]|uniref:Hsp70 family protein n=1 Tax=Streptomyces sp. GQFP TaxID=2907545 RepID=UPI001F16EEDF|nr:Hsp70 family protein [Streptomyces sp. GQFP]UIX35026.1 Hsp70 family protein [Streptomyces sp. GQFP]